MNKYKIQSEDRLQKTWIPEGSEEYKHFKLVTQENKFLAKFLGKKFNLQPGQFILDVGGREGDISVQLQNPRYIQIVDPDPTLKLPFKPNKLLKKKIQNVNLTGKYKLIICSHVWGYLGNQKVLEQVFQNLINLIGSGDSLVLFCNTNTGYMGELLKFSKKNLDHGHYDYFDEKLLDKLDVKKFKIEQKDVMFDLNYNSFGELARCCWFLFGAIDQDIDKVAKQFLPKLKKDLKKPNFPIEERITIITKK